MKNLIKIISYLLAAELTFGSPLSAKAQTVSGYITDLFNNQPIPQAIVTVDGLGSGITNDQGYYAIGDTTNVVEFPYVITPRKTSKIDIFNIIGQKVISLDNIIEGSNIDLNNFSKGIYILRHFDNRGEIIGHNRISNINGENPVVLSVPDRIIDVNPKDNGRKINSPMDNIEIRINHPDYWERVTYINEPIGNVEFNEGLIDGDSLFLDFVDETCNRTDYYGSVRWGEDPLIYIRPTFQNGQSVPQSEVDKCIDSILDLPTLTNGFITGQYVIVDSLPPAQTPGIIRAYWDGNLGFYAAHGVSYNNDHIIYYGSVAFKFSNSSINAIKHEFSQVVGPISDSDILLSVFNESGLDHYTQEDLNLGKALYSRNSNWKSPDTNNTP